jgi:alpha-N-arabinofuranosidase
MEKAGAMMNGLSLHYYTIPGEWALKGSATDFNQAAWLITMRKAARMDEIISRHSAIMDEFDPDRRVGLIVDEWGTWLDVEPGTNPGFLYQQNTLRDALAAAIHFNIFNNHAGRVHMANIAQTINVLQSVILTEGPQMILTPTYHIFDMYQVHQDAVMLPVYVESAGAGGIPAISASASRDRAGKLHISLVNIDPENGQRVEIELGGCTLTPSVKTGGQILTSERMQDHNTFDKPAAVTLRNFSGAAVESGKLAVELPPKSVVTVELT